jgi:hypothetical protein
LFVGTVNSTDTEPPAGITLVSKLTGDLDADSLATCNDLAIVRNVFGRKCGQVEFDPRAHVDNSCAVDIRDLALVARKLPLGMRCQ